MYRLHTNTKPTNQTHAGEFEREHLANALRTATAMLARNPDVGFIQFYENGNHIVDIYRDSVELPGFMPWDLTDAMEDANSLYRFADDPAVRIEALRIMEYATQ